AGSGVVAAGRGPGPLVPEGRRVVVVGRIVLRAGQGDGAAFGAAVGPAGDGSGYGVFHGHVGVVVDDVPVAIVHRQRHGERAVVVAGEGRLHDRVVAAAAGRAG